MNMSRDGPQTSGGNVRASTNIEEKQSPGSMKTPLQILHEHGTRTGNLPVFIMEKTEGMAHDPSFVFSVTVGDVHCTGEGPSKKAAKQKAAEAAMKVLNIDIDAENGLGSPNNDALQETESNPNSVGILQELALHRGWHLPEYTVLVETGPPHRKEFTVTCRVESLSEKAVGSSKKAAKRAAADRMVAKLQRLSGSSTITWTPTAKVGFEKLKSSTAEKMSSLRRVQLSVPNTDYIQMLLELSKEQGFEVTYFNIDELTVNGQYQCLAELSTSPVIVCHGTGISCSNAHNDAAHNALQYIKIMASKK